MIRDDQEFEAALEQAAQSLKTPPAPDTVEEEAFFYLVAEIAAYERSFDPPQTSRERTLAAELEELKTRLAARNAAKREPFGHHPDGIGPTLGMDVSHS